MTRSARRGEKKQALSATPWLELKNAVDNEQVQDTDRVRKVIKNKGLKATKKINSAKKLLKKLKQKTGRTLSSGSEELTPLLQVETDSDNSAGRSSRVRKQKRRGKKSVHFADDTEHLLASVSENEDLEVAIPKLKNKRRKVDQDESSNVTKVKKKVKKKDRSNQVGGGVMVSRENEKREKEREARRHRRAKKKVCFNCRQPGHRVSECPQSSEMGMCFKCGAAGHTSKKCEAKVPIGDFPYAKCFICGEVGHLSRSCPDNPRGLYPRGGGCNVCGSVEHLKANCPAILRREGSDSSLGLVISNQSADAEDLTSEETRLLRSPNHHRPSKNAKSKTKVVKF